MIIEEIVINNVGDLLVWDGTQLIELVVVIAYAHLVNFVGIVLVIIDVHLQLGEELGIVHRIIIIMVIGEQM